MHWPEKMNHSTVIKCTAFYENCFIAVTTRHHTEPADSYASIMHSTGPTNFIFQTLLFYSVSSLYMPISWSPPQIILNSALLSFTYFPLHMLTLTPLMKQHLYGSSYHLTPNNSSHKCPFSTSHTAFPTHITCHMQKVEALIYQSTWSQLRTDCFSICVGHGSNTRYTVTVTSFLW